MRKLINHIKSKLFKIVLGTVVLFTFLTLDVQASFAETRAFWVDAFHDGIKTSQQVDKLVDDAQKAGVNTLVVQVRRRGDAYYSILGPEPRTTDSKVPKGFDPLADVINKAHSRGIKVHAWLSTVQVRSDSEVYKNHPEWLSQTNPDPVTGIPKKAEGIEYMLDPGVTEVVDYTKDVFVHVARNYNVDGIQLDLVRYFSGGNWGYNRINLDRFRAANDRTEDPAPNDPEWQEWRRQQVNNLVREVYRGVKAAKPGVVVSAATITWGAAPSSRSGFTSTPAYKEVFQDWPTWLEQGYMDITMPMNYFREHDANQARYFDGWINWEKNLFGEKIVIGLGMWINTLDNALNQIRESLAFSDLGRKAGGAVLYSYYATNKDGISLSEALPRIAEAFNVQPVYNPPPQTVVAATKKVVKTAKKKRVVTKASATAPAKPPENTPSPQAAQATPSENVVPPTENKPASVELKTKAPDNTMVTETPKQPLTVDKNVADSIAYTFAVLAVVSLAVTRLVTRTVT